MRERRLIISGLVALLMLAAWHGPELAFDHPGHETARLSLAVDLRQAEITLTVVSGAAALLQAAR